MKNTNIFRRAASKTPSASQICTNKFKNGAGESVPVNKIGEPSPGGTAILRCRWLPLVRDPFGIYTVILLSLLSFFAPG
jgi:hypothetical protein